MTYFRTVRCDRCGGDGGWDDVVSRDPNGPVWRWFECAACDGFGEVDIEFRVIEMEDLA